jgi:hypothetical protein
VRTRPAVLLVALLALLPACTHEKKKADPNAELNAARGRLAVLAQATANGSYIATYRFVQRSDGTAGTIRFVQSPPRYRFDVIVHNSASYYELPTGVVSCARKELKKTCFLVARPGEQVPELYDPVLPRLFRDAVADLAANPTEYVVRQVPFPSVSPSATASASATATPDPSATPLPTGECYAVTHTSATPSADRTGFEDGTYCFAEQGIATYIDVTTGSMVLTAVGGTPDDASFKPITKVQKLPDLTPSPTPKK